MTEPRRGAVVVQILGDEQISGAIRDGIIAARTPTAEQQLIRRRTDESLLRIAVRKELKGPINKRIRYAQRMYGTKPHEPSIIRWVGRALLGVYGLVVLTVTNYFDFTDRRWVG